MAQALGSKDDRIEIQLPQVFRGVLLGTVARAGRPDTSIVEPPGVGRQVSAGVGRTDFQPGEAIERAVENQVGEKDGGLQRIADNIAK